MMINGILTRALSAAESYSFAVVTGTAEGLGLQSLLSDLELMVEVRVDGPERGKSVRIEKRLRKDKAHRVEILVGAKDDHFRKGEV